MRSRTAIQVDFYLAGNRCRETIPGVPTESAVREAASVRQAILFAIGRGRYVRDTFFPDKRRGGSKKFGTSCPKRMSALFDGWLGLKRGNVGENSHQDYSRIVDFHLKPRFGARHAAEVDLAALADFRGTLIDQGLSLKRIRNVLTPLRGALAIAAAEGEIDASPFVALPPLKVGAFKQVQTALQPRSTERFDEPLPANSTGQFSDNSDINPLTPAEREALLNCIEGQERAFFEFALWSGLRTGELIALRWCDVDFERRRVAVRQSLSRKILKGPKTAAGLRWVELDERGWQPLEAQFAFTGAANQRVFHNPRTSKPWAGDGAVRKRWTALLSRAKVAYRRPYQTRHTYASTLLSEGKNPLYVARQLGHKDWSMVVEVYGRWIPEVGQQARAAHAAPATRAA